MNAEVEKVERRGANVIFYFQSVSCYDDHIFVDSLKCAYSSSFFSLSRCQRHTQPLLWSYLGGSLLRITNSHQSPSMTTMTQVADAFSLHLSHPLCACVYCQSSIIACMLSSIVYLVQYIIYCILLKLYIIVRTTVLMNTFHCHLLQ